jgi:hypothetical protein
MSSPCAYFFAISLLTQQAADINWTNLQGTSDIFETQLKKLNNWVSSEKYSVK